MATTEDGAIGWELFRNSGFKLSLDEINKHLVAIGRNPVSDRMYLHYTRLERRGFRRYLSINRLDTMNVPDPFLDESIRSRYAFTNSDVPTRIVVHVPGADVSVVGVTDALSDFGAEVVVQSGAQADAIRKQPFNTGMSVTIDFLKPPHTSHGTIDFVAVGDPKVVVIGVRFRELTPVQALVGSESLDWQLIEFVIGAGAGAGAPGLDVVSQDVYWLLQAIEASRSILNILLDGMTSDSLYSPLPAVESLSVASPMKAFLKVSIQVYLIMNAALEKVASSAENLEKVKGAIGSRKVKASEDDLNESKAKVNDAYADYIAEQSRGQRLSNERHEIANAVLIDAAEFTKAAIRQAKKQLKQPDFNVERITKTVLEDLVPALMHLEVRGLTMTPPPLELTDGADGTEGN